MIKHIPLKTRGSSKDVEDNFLVEIDNNVFLMDNHRLALWCWFKKINLNQKYNFIHIDAHPDLSESAIPHYNRKKNPLEEISLDDYRKLIQMDINIPLFRWDNYIQILFQSYPELVYPETSYSFTHKLGSNQKLKNDLAPIYLISELEDVFTQKRFVNQSDWIFNLDLDFFFTSQPHKILMFDAQYIEKVGELIRFGLDNKLIKVLTIAFSPECCGSWEKAEQAFKILNKTLKLNIGELFN